MVLKTITLVLLAAMLPLPAIAMTADVVRAINAEIVGTTAPVGNICGFDEFYRGADGDRYAGYKLIEGRIVERIGRPANSNTTAYVWSYGNNGAITGETQLDQDTRSVVGSSRLVWKEDRVVGFKVAQNGVEREAFTITAAKERDGRIKLTRVDLEDDDSRCEAWASYRSDGELIGRGRRHCRAVASTVTKRSKLPPVPKITTALPPLPPLPGSETAPVPVEPKKAAIEPDPDQRWRICDGKTRWHNCREFSVSERYRHSEAKLDASLQRSYRLCQEQQPPYSVLLSIPAAKSLSSVTKR